MWSLSRRVNSLRSVLGERKSELERVASSRQSLFVAAGINGVFHRIDGELRLTVNPRRREDVLEQGTFDVYPPGEPGKIKTRVLVQSENGSLEYKRYPGQPEPEEGDWF